MNKNDCIGGSRPILPQTDIGSSQRFEAILQKCQSLENRIKDFNQSIQEGRPSGGNPQHPSYKAGDSGVSVRA